MPNGFRGDAAKTYLTAVNNALITARLAHMQPVFRSPGVGRHVALPRLPQPLLQDTPHLPDTAHSGGNVVGYGNSQNIVVDGDNYFSIEKKIGEADFEMARKLNEIAHYISELCDTYFVIPKTSIESEIIARSVVNALGEFEELTVRKCTQLRQFVSAILSIR